MPDDFDLDRDAEAAAREALTEALGSAPSAAAQAVGIGSGIGAAPAVSATDVSLPKRLGQGTADPEQPQSGPRQRGIRRWVYTSGGQPLPGPVEVAEDWDAVGRDAPRTSEEEIYGHLTATDGTPLDTRRKHRQYMERHGLTMESDFKETWAKKANERERAFTDNRYDRERRIEHLKRAVDQAGKRRR
jgi:hypothetical protein